MVFNQTPPSDNSLDAISLIDQGNGGEIQHDEWSLVGQRPMPQWVAAAVNPRRDAPMMLAGPPPGDGPPAPGGAPVPPGDAPQAPPAGNDGGQRPDIPRGERQQPEPRFRPLRQGQFTPMAPIGENLSGSAYLENRIDNLTRTNPAQVQEIQGAIAGLQNAATREQSIATLQRIGPAAVPFLLRQIDSENFRQRDAATGMLRLMGEAAVPGLYSFMDGPNISLEARRRAGGLLSELAPLVREGAYDDQGRLRLQTDKHGNTLFSADYSSTGEVSRIVWNRYGSNEQITRNVDGTYSRDGETQPLSNLRVDRNGNLTFTVANRNVEWNANGNVNLRTATNELLSSTTAGQSFTGFGTANGQPVSFSATPRRAPVADERFLR